jgi:Ser/Thr protein kinase RdoA (MazF antagonist)
LARLHFIHRALQESRAGGFSGVPDLARTRDGETVLALADGLYDAQEWVTGEPLSPMVSEGSMPNVVVALSSARIASLVTAVAHFHRSAMRFSSELASFANPLSARLPVLSEGAITFQDALSERVRFGADGRECRLTLRWLEAFPHLIEAAGTACDTFDQELADEYTLNHGDLWPAHAYFEGDEFTGFTDFEFLCFASPAFDLAQVILHFGGWHVREDVLQSYERVAPLSDMDRLIVPIEAGMHLTSEGYWSLNALYGDTSSRTTMEQRAAHVRNLRDLAGSLEAVDLELENLGR